MLIHYRDHGDAEADLAQWDERVWVFEREGERLRWSEYPIVVFSNGAGRFHRQGDALVRELGHWEPNEGQRREIAAGLRTNPREKRDRVLRPTAEGWSSATDRGYDSARFVTWSSVWEVDLSDPSPRFVMRDALGSSAAQAIQGQTVYAAEGPPDDGGLAGRFERDATRRGRFQMMRTGSPERFEAPRPREPEKEEVYDRFYTELGRQLRTRRVLPDVAAAEDRTPAGREAFQDRVREEVEALYQAQGNDPRPHAPQVEKLTVGITGLYLDAGLSREEIALRIIEGQLRP